MKFFEMLLEILPMVYYHYAQHSSAIWQHIAETFITGYDHRIVGLLDESPCKICVLRQESQYNLMEYPTALYILGKLDKIHKGL